MTVRKMAHPRQAYVKEDHDAHHPHQQQGPAPSQHLQHPRPSSIVQQHAQATHPQQHAAAAYNSPHTISPVYQASGAHNQSEVPYYGQPSPYSTPGATSGYPSADTSEMMAAAQMPRPPYPPMSYHTQQSNSPQTVPSPAQHDQHRSIYGQPPTPHMQQSMYYQQQPYQSMPTQPAPSPYAQHPQHTHQTMTSQPAMIMSQPAPQNQMAQHQAQHTQPGMTGSPRHMKQEPQVPLSIQKPQPGAMGHPHQGQNGAPLSTPTSGNSAVNPNAAPGPIPATTPLVVRQDQNGVQWIAFEYSRDRVKMEYTIRCDVEAVNTEELTSEFKTENCVYPRACCPKDQYRGNRLQYETECNTVGWALAQLNPPLRGKRGLIQRAVDSWRNSNQDPRLRSRRVRRMAKMNNRKVQNPHPGSAHMAAGGPPGMGGGPGSMGPGPGMGKPGLGSMGQMHGNGQGGDEVDGEGEYLDDQHAHHHQAMPSTGVPKDDVRTAHIFHGQYPTAYPTSTSGSSMAHMSAIPGAHGSAISARRLSRGDEPEDLFPDLPETKKRKFILVEDNVRGSRLRVRVTLDGVDTREIPDSFRKGSSVFPRSYFPREMQSPPPSPTGGKFFADDLSDGDDGVAETEGRHGARRGKMRAARGGKVTVQVPIGEGKEAEVAIPQIRRATRGKEVRLNDLGYRMAWLQSRVFAGRTLFLQRALDCYRNKMRSAIESTMQDVETTAPHYETRVGKRRWNDRMRTVDRRSEESS